MSDYHQPFDENSTPRYPTQKFFLAALDRNIGDDCLHWPFGKDSDGYGKIRFRGRCTRVSRAICEVAHGEAEDPTLEAAHSCGKRDCLNWRHLSWKTPVENAADKILHGTAGRSRQIGVKNPAAKLDEEQVLEIRRLAKHRSQREIARLFGIHKSTVWAIQQKKKWEWLHG